MMVRRLSTHSTATWRALATIAAALVVAGGLVTVSSASSPQADRLRAIETTRLKALVDADTATARRLMADDFQLINPAGALLTREELLGAVAAGGIDFRVLEPSAPIAVRLSGDSAALRYQTDYDVVVGDTHVVHKGWTIALYERRHGHWRIVWEQSTAVPNDLGLFVKSIEPTT
jgi:hypothetical protein